MNGFTYSVLRSITSTEIKALQAKADGGDSVAKWQMALCILFGQCRLSDYKLCHKYLNSLAAEDDDKALLLLGYLHEHAFGCEKDYAKAIEFYARAYDSAKPIAKKKTGKNEENIGGLELSHRTIVQSIKEIIEFKDLCAFKDGTFVFPWTGETRRRIVAHLPVVCTELEQFNALYSTVTPKLDDDKRGEWEFRYQDEILMPLEVLKSLVARDDLDQRFKDNGFKCLPHDVFFDEALGRCMIDDDDREDRDYIIGGLLRVAGHDANPLWQYRVGLWFEYCDDNFEPQTAAYWYSRASKALDLASASLDRIKGKAEYRILENLNEGTIEDCKRFYLKSSGNAESSLTWQIEGALRGDDEALHALQALPDEKEKRRVARASQETDPFYKIVEEERNADKKALSKWKEDLAEDWETCARNQVIYNLTITAVTDEVLATMTTFFNLEWTAEEAKANFNKLPFLAKELHSIDEAIGLSDELNKGGLQSTIKAVNGLGESIKYNVYSYSKELLNLASSGNPIAQYNLGMSYYNGDGTKKNEKEAMKWIRKAAEQDMDEAMFQLGYILVGNREFADGIKWLEKGADLNNADAQYHLGMCYRVGVTGLRRSESKSTKLITLAAKQGHIEAQLALGKYYYDKSDYVEAVKWYRMAAEQGNADGQEALAECLLNGEGVAVDRVEAFRWYLTAAEQGNSNAQYMVSECYRNGYGTKKSPTKAAEWLRKSGRSKK